MKKIDKKSQEFRNVISVMEENLSKWNHLTELRNSYDAFLKNNKKIEDLLVKANQKPDAVFENKMNVKQNLVVSLQPLQNVAELYARDNNDKKLLKKINSNDNNMAKVSDKKLMKCAGYLTDKFEALLNKENKKTKSPEDYGIKEDRIQVIKSEIDQLKQLKNEFETKNSEKKTSKSKVKKLMKKNEKILKKRIDKFMLLFRSDNPDFFKAYRIARNKNEL